MLIKKVIVKTMIVYGVIGLIIGLGILIFSFFNEDLTFHMGEKDVHGIVSGMIAVPFVTVIMIIVGFFHALMFWFPIVYLYKKLMNR